MKKSRIYISNIRKCTNKEKRRSELYKENAILIKTNRGAYIDIDNIKSIFDKFKLYKLIKEGNYLTGGIVIPLYPKEEGKLFIEQPINPLFKDQEKEENISIKKLKKIY